MTIHDLLHAVTDPGWQLPVAAATLVWIALVQLVRQHRARSIRRWAAAHLDEYADREVARDDLTRRYENA